jgi:predicted 3-demethylubiquinone-9 3-methyltransferase (glyoxalase superfamily)
MQKITPFMWFDNNAEEAVLGEYLSDRDTEKSKRVMKAMLQMDKIDIKALKQAYRKS